MSKLPGSDLHAQALRLPDDARDRLSAVADKLRAAGFPVSAAAVARGLCLLALEIARGSGGATMANVFRLTARNPTANGMRRALDTLLWMLDVEPITKPFVRAVRAGDRRDDESLAGGDLHNQALRVPKGVREQLETLAAELCAAGTRVTTAQATRGLCLLALEILHGTAGTALANAFRLAASDPTPEGARLALNAIHALFDGEPSMTPDPPSLDDPTPTTPRGDSSPPSTIPESRAA